MNYYKLDVFGDFNCIGSACPETCCAGGWTIYVDEDTYKKYTNIPGEFGEKLRQNIVGEPGKYHFKIDEKLKCPFLDENKLCEIYKELGPESMCSTCKTYPRALQVVSDNDLLMGFQISCPEVARLVFSKKEKIRCICDNKGEEKALDEKTQQAKELLLNGLAVSLSIVQNRELNISQRLKLLILFNDMLEQEVKAAGDPDEIFLAYSDEKNQIALAENLEELETEPLLLTKLFLILTNYYTKEKSSLTALMADVLGIVNKKIASGSLNMENMIDAIRGDAFDLYMEHYLVYMLFKNYFSAGKNIELIDILRFPIYMYGLNACFLALYTERKGAPLDFEETIVVYSHISRFVEHNTSTVSKIKALGMEAGLDNTLSLLGLV